MTVVPPQRSKVTTAEEVPKFIPVGGVILATSNEIREGIREIKTVI